MAPKVEILAAFQHFKHSDLDHTFKRSPGLQPSQQELSSEQLSRASKRSPGLQRSQQELSSDHPSRARPQSAPPGSLSWEPPGLFHHRQLSRDEPRCGRRAAATCLSDKCDKGMRRSTSRRGAGHFSPDAASTPRARSSIAADFRARGVGDIDRNVRRGAGLRTASARAGKLENDQEFSEEQHALLKRSSATMTQIEVHPESLAYVQDLGHLGIEHRRLMTMTLSHSASQERFAQQGYETSQQKLDTVCEQSPSVSIKTKVMRKAAAPNWMSKLDHVNVNSRRLKSAFSSPQNNQYHTIQPKRELTKSLLRLIVENGPKGNHCPTISDATTNYTTDATTDCSLDEDSLADTTSEGEHLVNPNSLSLSAATESASCSECSIGEPFEDGREEVSTEKDKQAPPLLLSLSKMASKKASMQ